VLTIAPSCGTGGRVITFPDFRQESIDFDPKAGTISFTGKCNVTKPTETALVVGS
jgi:hypothetical protein